MKLFLREQLPLAITYLLQIILLLFILWLDGYQHIHIYLYAVMVSSLLLFGYLAFRYFSMYSFYQRLSSSLLTIDESIEALENSPLSIRLSSLLTKQYQVYKKELLAIETKMENHITFLHQWVHQMKTPLSVMYLLIQSDESLNKREVQTEVDRLKYGLELVLYLSRMENIERDLHIEAVQLEKVINQVLIEHRQLLIQSRLLPEVKIDPSLVIISDPKWLAFILGQVVTNAVRYSAGKSSHLSFVSQTKKTETILEIIDYGIGIPKHDLRRVFDPYFTGKKGSKYGESTGMGLYLVKKVCNHLNHVVEIESKENVGTTVRFRFPVFLTKL